MLVSRRSFSSLSASAVYLGPALLCSLLTTLYKHPRKTAVVADILRVRGGERDILNTDWGQVNCLLAAAGWITGKMSGMLRKA